MGQNLIDSAKINRLVSDLRQYEVAVAQFKNKYNQIPGDSSYFSPPGAPDNVLGSGDTDGDGAPNNSTPCNGTAANTERHQFWAHLSQAKMISEDYPIIEVEIGIICGASQNRDDFNLGKYTPSTKVDPEVNQNQLSGTAGDTYAIFAYKVRSNANLYLELFTLPLDGLAIEKKMGSKTNNGSETQIGLTNLTGENLCADENFSATPVSCGDQTAALAIYNYYIEPQ